jgi:hypothetical protein
MMRNRISSLVLLAAIFLALSGVVLAEAPAAMKPGPEHQKLSYFVGKWVGEGTMAASPFGPAGKITSKEDCEWFEGNFAIVCKSQGTSPAGPGRSLGILSYSPEEKVYTYYGLESSGMTSTTVARGTVTGNTWTYSDEAMMGGKKIKSRYVMKTLSPTSYEFKWETQGDKGQWTTVLSGKSTKSAAEPAKTGEKPAKPAKPPKSE